MGEHHAQVGVAVLGDAAEALNRTAGELFGREAEIGGEGAARAKAVDIAYEGDQSGGGEDADAGDGHESGEALETRTLPRRQRSAYCAFRTPLSGFGLRGRTSCWHFGAVRRRGVHPINSMVLQYGLSRARTKIPYSVIERL